MDRVVILAAGEARLRVVPALGGRITSLRLQADGTGPAAELLHPFPEDASPASLLHWPKGGIYPLVPYGNRVRGAELVFGGTRHRLPPHPDALPHTLHGHAHRRSWRLEQCREDAVTWSLDHPGGDEWPWPFAATMTAALHPDRAILSLRLRNTGPDAMPAGIGLHPYFAYAPADRVGFRTTIAWPTSPDDLADDPVEIEPDQATPTPLPNEALTYYRSGWDGRASLVRADGGTVRIEASPAFGHLVVHRPGDGRYLCLEPASHAPDGFNAGERGLVAAGRMVLAPGTELAGTVTMALAR